MGKVIIHEETVKNPITLMGKFAGECWGADTSDDEKNYKRGLSCIKSNHGRVLEFPDVYMILDGFSARVIREWYTHIGGAPTRLQASTRYIDYAQGFDFVVPPSVVKNPNAMDIFCDTMIAIEDAARILIEKENIPKEDANTMLPLCMSTKISCKHNARNLMDMSHQRECSRAYWEFRELFNQVKIALREYSPEWATLVDVCFMPKCKYLGFCPEERGCGAYPKKDF